MNWQSFPNPSEKRKNWICLNGEWLLNGMRIVVPFCPESAMSKYAWEIEDRRNMVYEKSFFIPEDFEAEHANRLLLHLDGVDQTCTVIINQKPVGGHSDGYTKAVFDVTGYVSRDKENFLQIIACDTLSHEYPYGKQKYKRGGMWYTPCSGVWKSVWLEAVPDDYIKDLRIDTDLESFSVSVDPDLLCDHSLRLKILAPEIISGDKEAGSADFLDEEDEYWDCIIDTTGISKGDGIKVNLSELKSTEGRDIPVRHWSPDEPWIYQMYISTGFDTVKTYFALRTVRIAEVGGQPRVLLNDEPVFLNGLLDQGYYTESLYLPKTEEDYEKDILGVKELGFNLLRKHIKTESDWFYYYCDIHGMLVMQDMVNTGHYRYITDTVLPTIGIFVSDDRRRYASKKRRSIFKEHVLGVAAQVHNHPSVIMFTIFNEGWGQHDSDDYYDLLKAAEPDRIIDSTSGWFMGRKSDLDSRHIYFKLREVTHKKGFEDRPVFISECGGYSYAVEGHLFNPSRKYGYGACDSPESLTDRIEKLYDEMIVPGIQNGVCGSIYTQVSDVEDEINGIYTYDREVCKVNRERMKKIFEKAAKAILSKGLVFLLVLMGAMTLTGCDGARKSGRRTPTPTPVVNVRDPYASIDSDKGSNLVPVPTLFPDGKRRDTTPTPRPTPTDTPVPTEGPQGGDKQPTPKPKKTPTPTPKPTNTPRPTKAPRVTLTPTPEPTATPTPGAVDYELIPATPTPRA